MISVVPCRDVIKSPVTERKNNTSINLATSWKDKNNLDVLKFNENGTSRQLLRVESSSESCLEVNNKIMVREFLTFYT